MPWIVLLFAFFSAFNSSHAVDFPSYEMENQIDEEDYEDKDEDVLILEEDIEEDEPQN